MCEWWLGVKCVRKCDSLCVCVPVSVREEERERESPQAYACLVDRKLYQSNRSGQPVWLINCRD